MRTSRSFCSTEYSTATAIPILHISSNQYISDTALTRDLDNDTISAADIGIVLVGDVLDLDGDGRIHSSAPDMGLVLVEIILEGDRGGHNNRIAHGFDLVEIILDGAGDARTDIVHDSDLVAIESVLKVHCKITSVNILKAWLLQAHTGCLNSDNIAFKSEPVLDAKV